MGGVTVRSKRDPAEEASERERRKQERAQRRLERSREQHGHHAVVPAQPTSPPQPPQPPQPSQPPQPPDPGTPVEVSSNGHADGLPGAARSPGIPIAPDGTVTILFSDIEGFTAMTQRLGDLQAREVLARHNSLVRHQVATCGGYIVKTQGDGFMVAFAGAAKALRCAIGIQRAMEEDGREHPDSPLRVRIGLHTGEALRVDDDFHGNAVNMAARIAATAGGGEVLVSSLLRELTDGSGEFAFDGPRHVTLKGFDGERAVYSLRWAEQPA